MYNRLVFNQKNAHDDKSRSFFTLFPISESFFSLPLQKRTVMEQLLHYVWKHKMWPIGGLVTTDGRRVEVIDPGLHNLHAGPDFFNAKVKIDDTLWVGNVEIHDRSKDWYLHHHDHDKAYDNVVLHVAGVIDGEVLNTDGQLIPQVQLSVPPAVSERYRQLLADDGYPPCHKMVAQLPRLTLHSWMAALQTERLEQKTEAIGRRVEAMGGSWEDAFFATLARNYGFGVNGDTFEQWAVNLGLGHVAHHRDDLFQVEALFMGQAGLLDPGSIPERHLQEALSDGYFDRLRREYLYLAHKFSMHPIDFHRWKFLRMRPQNFPHIRISQLAWLYCERKASLSALTECMTLDDVKQLLEAHVTPYWETHYTFGAASQQNAKSLSPYSTGLLAINTAVPMLFAYGRHTANERLCSRAFEWLEELKAENNAIIRMWKACGIEVRSAGDSQALIQLKKEYCDRKNCLRCRIGYEYLKEGRRMGCRPFCSESSDENKQEA